MERGRWRISCRTACVHRLLVSGLGVPMALHNVRAHLLARARKVIDGALGEAKASAIGGRVDALEVGFLAGVSSDLAKECVALLGGAAPGEKAEIEEEGGSVSSGSFGKVTGEGAAAAIRDAFSTWAEGMGATLGAMPGGPRADFGMSAMLRRIKGSVGDEALISVCRYVLDKTYAGLLKHRSVLGRELPDLSQIVDVAGGRVFAKRRTDERLRRRAREEFDRWQQVSLPSAHLRSDRSAARTGRTDKKGDAPDAPATVRQTGWKGDIKRKWREEGAAVPSPAPSASRLASDLLSSLEHTVVPVAAPTESPAAAKKGKFTRSAVIKNRTQAIIELSALWREEQGWLPGRGDPAKEPCAAKALLGECTHEKCVRCA